MFVQCQQGCGAGSRAQRSQIKDGIYVYVGGPRPNDAGPESNGGIILTRDGVVLIDTGQTPLASRAIQDAVKKLTSQPVRYIIHTETHADHWAGDYLFLLPLSLLLMREPRWH